MPEQHVLLCRYHYDPLDRLAGFAQTRDADARFFYRKNRLATQVQGALGISLLLANDQPLVQQQGAQATLLASDRQQSVVCTLHGSQRQDLSYTTYGHQPAGGGLASLLGFNGERRDPVTGHYLLGNGYRAFNPVLMRFNSPDSLSPFAEGGANAYAYCQGDPVNYIDPHGTIKRRILMDPLRRNPLLNRILDVPVTKVVRPNSTAAQATGARSDLAQNFIGQASRSSTYEVAGSSAGPNDTVLLGSTQVQGSEISRNQMLRKMAHVSPRRLAPGEYFKKPAGSFMPPPKPKPVGVEYFRESGAGERLVAFAPEGREAPLEQGLSLQAVEAAVAAVRS